MNRWERTASALLAWSDILPAEDAFHAVADEECMIGATAPHGAVRRAGARAAGSPTSDEVLCLL